MRGALSRREVIKGCSRSAVVVKSPGPLFSEAIFLLRNELLEGEGDCRRALLRQAEEAAGRQAAALSPGRRPGRFLLPLLCFLVGLAAGLVIGLLG